MPIREEEIEILAADLAAYADVRGVPDDLFDDMVYDAAGEERAEAYHSGEDDEESGVEVTGDDDADWEELESAYSSKASEINNEGMTGQLRYLLEGYPDLAVGYRELRAVIDTADAPQI